MLQILSDSPRHPAEVPGYFGKMFEMKASLTGFLCNSVLGSGACAVSTLQSTHCSLVQEPSHTRLNLGVRQWAMPCGVRCWAGWPTYTIKCRLNNWLSATSTPAEDSYYANFGWLGNCMQGRASTANPRPSELSRQIEASEAATPSWICCRAVNGGKQCVCQWPQVMLQS